MVTGIIKNKVDKIWTDIRAGGITNPLTVIEQLTYLMFIRSLDEKELETEEFENMTGEKMPHIFPQSAAGQAMRWSRFKNNDPRQIYGMISQRVFPAIKNIRYGRLPDFNEKGELIPVPDEPDRPDDGNTAFARYMGDAMFLIPTPQVLQKGGRCACIVPDGVLFGSSKAHKDIRRELVENHQLRAVISMPSGVFKPYAGVSTAVLVFTKTGAGGTDQVWFYDMKADGYSLDDKRSEIKENDIPDIVARFRTLHAPLTGGVARSARGSQSRERLPQSASLTAPSKREPKPARSRAFLSPRTRSSPTTTTCPLTSTSGPRTSPWSTRRRARFWRRSTRWKARFKRSSRRWRRC